MSIASALHRKRDEIAATIAACEARIEVARLDLAALDQAARLFDTCARRDETILNGDLGMIGELADIQAADREPWQSAWPLAVQRSVSPVAEPEAIDDEDTAPFQSGGARGLQLTGKLDYLEAQHAGEQIPDEFFYLSWP